MVRGFKLSLDMSLAFEVVEVELVVKGAELRTMCNEVVKLGELMEFDAAYDSVLLLSQSGINLEFMNEFAVVLDVICICWTLMLIKFNINEFTLFIEIFLVFQ